MEHWGLFTDLYELTMAASFLAEGRDEPATFELFVRRLPRQRDYLVVCGIETALERLKGFRFDDADLAYLRTLDLFDEPFLEHLARLEFSGEIRAMAEGELAYAGEPLLSVTGPLIETQLVETLLINTVGFETMVATKAARVAVAAAGRTFVDFSARRDHGFDAALRAARASAVGGAVATSLVEAGRRYGLALSGTMAHSYVLAHGHERDAFEAFLRQYREKAVLLVDTHDTVQGTREAVAAMAETGIRARAIRLDSGDLDDLARRTRAILDEAGYADVFVFASGDLDEDRITRLVAAGAPIEAFGVGTRMGTSSDAPYLGMVYKLVEQGGAPRWKTSRGKATLPGRKQIWRDDGRDVIALAAEAGPPGARPLLAPVWRDGTRLGPRPPLAAAKERCAAALGAWSGAPAIELSPALAAVTRGEAQA